MHYSAIFILAPRLRLVYTNSVFFNTLRPILRFRGWPSATPSAALASPQESQNRQTPASYCIPWTHHQASQLDSFVSLRPQDRRDWGRTSRGLLVLTGEAHGRPENRACAQFWALFYRSKEFPSVIDPAAPIMYMAGGTNLRTREEDRRGDSLARTSIEYVAHICYPPGQSSVQNIMESSGSRWLFISDTEN